MSILNTYLRDISRYQPLTIEQELTLGEQARAGNQQARKRLIEAKKMKNTYSFFPFLCI